MSAHALDLVKEFEKAKFEAPPPPPKKEKRENVVDQC
jgi:hypothetical protein